MTTLERPLTAVPDGTEQILGSAPILQAFIECSDALQARAKSMIAIITSREADHEDRYLAANTLFEILFPHSNEGDRMLGMDLDAANRLVKNHGLPAHHPDARECDEAADILRSMEAEEKTFSERLGAVMAKKGLTQAELAVRIGVGQPAIAMMLKRECRPQKKTLHRLSEALEVPISELWP